MTLIIVLVVAACFAAGAVMIRRSMRDGSQAGERIVCPKCGADNPVHAKYCAQCGETIG